MIIFFCILIILFGFFLAVLYSCRGRNYIPRDVEFFECGIKKFENKMEDFDIRFPPVILFLVFDAIILFMIIYSTCALKCGWIGFCSIILFSLPSVIGFLYFVKKE